MSGVGVTITEAAKELGISREALRKRIIRGKLPAHKDAEGVWRIVLPRPDSADIKAADREDSKLSDSLSTPASQLQSVMDQWLRPLVSEIRELATENGRLRLENEQLRSALEASERPAQDESRVPARNAPPGDAGAAEQAPEKPQRWPWWMRILAGK